MKEALIPLENFGFRGLKDRIRSLGQVTHMLQEEVQLGVTPRVDGDFEQRHEDILQHLLEVGELLLGVVHVTGEVRR